MSCPCLNAAECFTLIMLVIRVMSQCVYRKTMKNVAVIHLDTQDMKQLVLLGTPIYSY